MLYGKRAVAEVLVLTLALSSLAGTPVVPATIADSTRQYQQASEKANAAWKQATLAAKKQYVRELEKGVKAAMAKSNLEEANQISAIKKAVEAEIDALTKGKLTYQVLATENWQKFGSFRKGEKLRFRATGQWDMNRNKSAESTTGPDGELTNGKGFMIHGVLEGRIGKQVFSITRGCSIEVEEDGVLEMGPHDDGVSDNAGALTVVVESVTEIPSELGSM